MKINRTYDFENNVYSSLATEVEQSFKSHLESNNLSPNTSRYYLEQIKSSLNDIAVDKSSSKMTVADMVDDLMKRTGLNNYIEQIKANAFNEQEQEQKPSFIDIDSFKRAIDHYIDQFHPGNSVSVLVSDSIQNVLEQLKAQGEIPEELLELPLNKDERLISYIETKHRADEINSSIHQDSIYDLTSAPNSADLTQDFGAEWNKGS
jgi:hypothetical protein